MISKSAAHACFSFSVLKSTVLKVYRLWQPCSGAGLRISSFSPASVCSSCLWPGFLKVSETRVDNSLKTTLEEQTVHLVLTHKLNRTINVLPSQEGPRLRAMQ